jgi:hypothetical protein
MFFYQFNCVIVLREAKMDGDLSEKTFRVELMKRNFNNLSAGAHAEACVYSLNNPYLSRMQKGAIEAGYQLPFGAFYYTLILLLIINGVNSWFNAYLVASAISIAFWTISWFIPGRFAASIGILFAGSSLTVGCLMLAGVAAYQGLYDVAGIAAVISLAGGFLLLISPPMWLYIMFSKEMNPKYVLAKKMWGLVFPFEKYLRQKEKA